jgi:hypothetical protein
MSTRSTSFEYAISLSAEGGMRLVVWNCRMALHRPEKWNALAGLSPDLAVIPEAPSPTLKTMSHVLGAAHAHAWTGADPAKKGLGLFSFGDYGFTRLPPQMARHDTLAVNVTGPATSFVLIGVWACKPRYVEHLHDALDAYEPILRTRDVVIAGDFNSNTIWDRPHRDKCHSRLVARLEELGLVSAYHFMRREAQGAETQKTFFTTARGKGHYHIDYVFLPRSWLPRLDSYHLGTREPWLTLSDHVPISVDLQPERTTGAYPKAPPTRTSRADATA